MGKQTIADLEKLMVNVSASLERITTKLSSMEDALNISLEENKSLNSELAAKNKIIEKMTCKVNLLEHGLNRTNKYQCSWSEHVTNIPLTSAEKNNYFAIKKKVYDLALKPILTGALPQGDITAILEVDSLLEVAHVLPAKPGADKPIVA
jgi:hypothetical protein